MSVNSHIDSLQTKHDAIGKLIESAYAHHYEDVDVLRMKKEKLRLKDEIHRYQIQAEEVA